MLVILHYSDPVFNKSTRRAATDTNLYECWALCFLHQWTSFFFILFFHL